MIKVMESNKNDFYEWKKNSSIQFCQSLPNTSLKIGDMVTFTNEFGLVFGPYEVLAFKQPDKYGRCVFINKDSYWFPVTLDSLKVVEQ